MKLLVTNDDGIDAEGIAALAEASRMIGEVVVVAPAGPQSGVSHAVTTGKAVCVDERGAGRLSVSGTPADCVRVGLLQIVPDARFILSGINHGGNLGADVYYSGTVAAVREAVLHGWTGVALSQYKKKRLDFDWPRTTRWATRVLADLLARPSRTSRPPTRTPRSCSARSTPTHCRSATGTRKPASFTTATTTSATGHRAPMWTRAFPAASRSPNCGYCDLESTTNGSFSWVAGA